MTGFDDQRTDGGVSTDTGPSSVMPLVAGVLIVGLIVAAIGVVRSQRARLYPAQLMTVSAEIVVPSAVRGTATPLSATSIAGSVGGSAGPNEGRTLDPYRGLGAWIDAFDYSPNYAVEDPPLTPAVIDEMAAANVRTVFVQAARNDRRSPGLLEDPWLLAELLVRAHNRNMSVVAWYLPKLAPNDARDIQQLQALVEFEFLGHRFDGVAVDIEAEPEPTDAELAERNAALINLSKQLRAMSGNDVLGAIVLPPPLIEDVNENFWPEFPWADIGSLYDVWLPMSYWSGRSNESGFGDGYGYNTESTRRIRERIGQPDAPVHGIGGIGSVTGERDFTASEILAGVADLPRFAESLRDTDSIGGSIYDWLTIDEASRIVLTELFATGPAANLGN